MPDDKFAWSSPADIEWQTEGDQKKAKQDQMSKLKDIGNQIRDKAEGGNSTA